MKNTSLTDQASNNVIRLYKGEETGIINETYESKDSSLFAKQYTMAFSEIKAYLDTFESKSSNQNISTVNDRSNIFAFIGDRGTGKTSCMQSVAGMLEQYYTSIGIQKTFMKLPIIDPTIFDDNTNILQVVIGTLFNEFKEKINHPSSFGTEKEDKEFEVNKQKVLKAFQDVKDCIRIIGNPDLLKCEGNDISQLADMASVSQLHSKMGTLVKSYLEFCKRDVFVLQVDDIDLQTQYAYKMVDDIRKYFVLPDVIILMSFKLEQLQKVIELENTKNYEKLLQQKLLFTSDIQEMSARYILKLIPVNHRIFMPTFEAYVNKGLHLYESRSSSSKVQKWSSVKYAITTLIYRKCRFLFYHSKWTVNPIVPRNLRDLRHLIELLSSMKDYPNHTDNKKTRLSNEICRKNNKSAFLNYFYNTWAKNNLSIDDYKIVNNILQVGEAARINKMVVRQLFDKYTAIFKADAREISSYRDIDYFNSLQEIFDARNSAYNISMADVYTVLDYVQQRASEVPDQMLVFFIETYYSIKLYEYYDELTEYIDNAKKEENNDIDVNVEEDEDSDEEALPDMLFDENDNSDESIRQTTVTDMLNDLDLLIGGSFINTDVYKFMPRESNVSQAGDKRIISYKTLRDEAKNLLKGDPATVDASKLKVIEFFALGISKVNDRTFDVANRKYRTSGDLYYLFDSKNKYTTAEFDLGAFFFNITDVRLAYNRVHPNLFKYVSLCPNSLYKDIISACNDDRGYDKVEHSLLSCVTIRNYDVLSDFIFKTRYGWKSRSRGSWGKNLKAFFAKVAGYKIKTYDREEPTEKAGVEALELGKPRVISFSYADVVVKVLDSVIDEHTESSKLFKKILSIDHTENSGSGNQTFEQKKEQWFDREKILIRYPKQEYSVRYIYEGIKNVSRPFFEKHQKANEFLSDWKKRMDARGGKVTQEEIRILLDEIYNKFMI